jgi:chromate reductase, NAD(P)H dehydrogenase (quinone)
MPIYSIDKEKENGLPDLAKMFYEKLGTADCIIISFSEHNGSYTTAFKNIFDWTSRVHVKVFQDKPVLLLAAAPGGRGAITVLETATTRFPFHGALIKGSFSLPNFNANFDPEKGIVDPELNAQFLSIIASIEI